jgi:hypothetical protein
MDRSIKLVRQIKQVFEPYLIRFKEVKGAKQEEASLIIFVGKKRTNTENY